MSNAPLQIPTVQTLISHEHLGMYQSASAYIATGGIDEWMSNETTGMEL